MTFQRSLRVLILAAGMTTLAGADEVLDDQPDAGGPRARATSIPAMALSGQRRAALILDRGRQLFEAGEYPQATDALLEVAETGDLPPAVVAEARLLLGHIARLEGNCSGARKYLAAVVALADAPAAYRAEAQYHIGHIYMQEGDLQAVPEFGKVLDMSDAPAEYTGRTLLMLGRLAFENHEDAEAERFLQSALAVRDIQPEDGAWARLWMGRLAFRRGYYAVAREFLNLATAMPAGDPAVVAPLRAAMLLDLADVWLAENNLKEATAAWRALADMPRAPMHQRLAAQRQLDARAGTPRPALAKNGLELDFSVWAEAFAGPADRAFVMDCPAFALFGERLAARPGDRWLELFADLRDHASSSGKLTMKILLYDMRTDRLAAELQADAAPAWGWLRVDLRRHELEQARLRVELHAGRKLLGAVETSLQAAGPEADTAAVPQNMGGQWTPVGLDAPTGVPAPANWPVAFGVPFAAGECWDVEALRLVNDAGTEIPSQKEITGRWAEDGSVQWVRFDALVTPSEGCNLEAAPSRSALPAPLRLTEQKGVLTVDTGVARYVLAPGKSPVREIFLGDRRLAFCGPQSRGLYVVTQDDRVGQAADDNVMVVEARGPVSACVRFEGYYRAPAAAAGDAGAPLARHITRLEFFAGHAWAKITHTLVLSEDTRAVWFKEVGWEFDAAISGGARKQRAPRASFGVERAHPGAVVAVSLDQPTSAAHMLQVEHYRFYGGTNRCVVMRGDADEDAVIEYAGAEMGDWAMLDGPAGGLMLACRESARQHPKEFEVHPDRMTLKLFSNRADPASESTSGEELDFRAATLVRKWNLDAWYPKDRRESYRKLYQRDPLEAIAEIDSNAGGWAKTHDLMIAPMAPAPTDAMAAAAARLAHLHSFPVYARISPWQIYKSRAMGAIYPCSPEKYPAAETMIESLWRSRLPGGHEAGGRYGFVDYYHGPGYNVPIGLHRYGLAYTLRHDIWLTCARTWDRALREFAENTTRAYLDNYLCHWPAPRKTAGLYNTGFSAPFDTGTSDLPFLWGSRTTFHTSSSTDLRQFQWLYQLAGERRGADAVRAFGAGLKSVWRLAASTEEIVNDRRNVSTGRVLMALKTLTQSYAFTWDPELRFLANDTGRLIYDRDAQIGITKRLPRPEFIGSYYKVNEDAGALLDAWAVFGAPRYHAMVQRLGGYLWDTGIGMFPISRKQGPLGRLGVFFYDETGNPWIPAALDFQMRWACTHYNADTGAARPVGASAVTFVLQGMPMIMDVLERFAATQTPPAPWLAFDDYGQPVRVAFRKPHGRPLDIWFKSETRGGATGGNIKVEPLAKDRLGYDQITVSEQNFGLAAVHLPLEAPGTDYAIITEKSGFHLAFADQALPMVIYAPSFWRLPALRPAVPVYFRVPAESAPARMPRMLVEGGARFFDPAGKPWRGGEVLRGWVDLPGDMPGLWRFDPDQDRLVRAVNLPPFFALGRPEFYFEPDLPWAYQTAVEPKPEDKTVDAGKIYVPGAIEDAGDEALSLAGNRTFELKAGTAHPSGNGGLFLPRQAGSIEFFFKPYWDTFELAADDRTVIKPMLSVQTDKTPWNFVYRIDPNGTTINMGPREPAHSLFGSFWTDGRQRVELRCWRMRTLFDRNQWVHIAWVWGPDVVQVGTRRFDHVMKMRIYVNGRGHTQSAVYTNDGNLPEGLPQKLLIGAGMHGAIDELRISDIQRYPADFIPPARDQGLKLDQHTRALFRFNGNLKGESPDGQPAPVGELPE